MNSREVRRALSRLQSAAAHYHDEYDCGDSTTARHEARAVRDALAAGEHLRKLLRGVMESGSVLFLCDGKTVDEIVDLCGARNIARSSDEETTIPAGRGPSDG